MAGNSCHNASAVLCQGSLIELEISYVFFFVLVPWKMFIVSCMLYTFIYMHIAQYWCFTLLVEVMCQKLGGLNTEGGCDSGVGFLSS